MVFRPLQKGYQLAGSWQSRRCQPGGQQPEHALRPAYFRLQKTMLINRWVGGAEGI